MGYDATAETDESSRPMKREWLKAAAVLLWALFVAVATVIAVAPNEARSQEPVKPCAEGFSADGSNQSCGTLVQPQMTASTLEASHIFKSTGPATVVEFNVNSTSAAVSVILFDAAAVPANGAVTGCVNSAAARPCIARVWQLAASSTLAATWSPGPFLKLQAGMIVACSTTAPFTFTASATCLFSGEAM